MNYSAWYHVFPATFHVISQKVNYLWESVDRQTKHSLPLTKLTTDQHFLSEWKVGRFCGLKKSCTVNELFLVFSKKNQLKFVYEVCIINQNKQRQIYILYIFPPLSIKPTDICALCTCNAESQKRSAKGLNFKENDRALPI